MRKTGYVKSAAILTGTGLVLRAAGMVLRVYVAGQLGAGGMGVYQLIFTVYNLSVTLATAGLSVTATRLCAQCLARGAKPRFGPGRVARGKGGKRARLRRGGLFAPKKQAGPRPGPGAPQFAFARPGRAAFFCLKKPSPALRAPGRARAAAGARARPEASAASRLCATSPSGCNIYRMPQSHTPRGSAAG